MRGFVPPGRSSAPRSRCRPPGTERDRLFNLVLAVAPGYADHERQSGRTLPVVVLHPEPGDVLRVRAAGDELVKLHDWFRQELAELRAEHSRVDQLRRELSVLVESDKQEPAGFDSLATEPTRHLDREEQLLVPLLNALPEVPWP